MIDCSHGKTSSVTRRNRGGGCSIPLPVSPSPTGRFPIDTAPRERFPSAGFRRELPEESCFPPWHGIRTIAMHCPPPRKGAGGGRGSGRELGVFQRKPFNRRCMRQGRGMFHPLPVSPSHTGAIPHRYSAAGEISFSWFQARNSPKFLLPRTRPPSQSPFTARPLEGAGGGAERAGRRGWLGYSQEKTFPVICRRQGRGMFHPHPRRAPPPRGAIDR